MGLGHVLADVYALFFFIFLFIYRYSIYFYISYILYKSIGIIDIKAAKAACINGLGDVLADVCGIEQGYQNFI